LTSTFHIEIDIEIKIEAPTTGRVGKAIGRFNMAQAFMAFMAIMALMARHSLEV